jgi:hypothetical protein
LPEAVRAVIPDDPESSGCVHASDTMIASTPTSNVSWLV